jgi:hypothetical protein
LMNEDNYVTRGRQLHFVCPILYLTFLIIRASCKIGHC